MQPLFELTNVRFRDVLNIDHLQIATGRVTCIVGPSGCGKSTLMRLLNRMIAPTSGTITFRGEDIATHNAVELRRRVVMLPQNPIMFDGSVRDNVNKGLSFSNRPPASDDEISTLLQQMQMTPLPGSNAAYLSGGERQRVALCRVLTMQPEVLLLDEPTSALDDGTEDIVMRNVVAASQKSGADLILVTHSRAVAERWGQDVIEMDIGQITRIRTGNADV